MSDITDLNTQTVLDVVEANFKAAGFKTFPCRIFYAGKHSLDKEELKNHFAESVQYVNAGYCDIELTGLLLVYNAYYVHILEGSEDSLNRQLKSLLSVTDCHKDFVDLQININKKSESECGSQNSQESNSKIICGKVLVVYHSVSKLMFKQWHCMMEKPATLTVKLASGEMSDHLEHLHTCVRRINKLCVMFAENNELTFEGLSAADPRMDALPEYELLELLLYSPHVLDLKDYLFYYHHIDDFIHNYEKVWPLPTHFTPRHMYKLQETVSFVPPLPPLLAPPGQSSTPTPEEEEEAALSD